MEYHSEGTRGQEFAWIEYAQIERTLEDEERKRKLSACLGTYLEVGLVGTVARTHG